MDSFSSKYNEYYQKINIIRVVSLVFISTTLFLLTIIYYYWDKSYTLLSILLVVFLLINVFIMAQPAKGVYIYKTITNHSLFFLISFITLVTLVYTLTIHYKTTSAFVYSSSGYFLDVLIFVTIVLLAMIIIYRQFKDYLNSQRGSLGLLVQFVFYIPCILSDLLKWALGEAKSTSLNNWYLIALETALILLYFNYGAIVKATSVKNSTVTIREEASFLNSEEKLMTAEEFGGLIVRPHSRSGKSLEEAIQQNMAQNLNQLQDFLMDEDSNGADEGNDEEKDYEQTLSNVTVNRNFCLYFWLYLNDNHSYTGLELPVLQYGGGQMLRPRDSNSPYKKYNVHPAVVCIPGKQTTNTFANDVRNSNIGHLGVYFDNSSEPVVVDVPFQKWNLIAFNYGGNVADLFVNGELVYTHTLSSGNSIFNISDYISIGGDNIHGAIKKISYSPTTLSSTSIISLYNMNMFYSQLLPTYVLR